MIKSLFALTLVSATAAAVACPDGFKSMDAKAPEERKPVVSEAAAAAQARSETTKAPVAKTPTKPAVAAATPVEAKKLPAGS